MLPQEIPLIQNFLHGQVGIVVSVPGTRTPNDADIMRPAVERAVNSALFSHLLTVPLPPASDAVTFELAPARFTEFVRSTPTPVGPILEFIDPVTIPGWPTTTVLPRKAAQSGVTTSIVYWARISRNCRVKIGDSTIDLSREFVGVRELVNLINLDAFLDRVRIEFQRVSLEGSHVLGASPNWLTAVAGLTCHGPGGAPKPLGPHAGPPAFQVSPPTIPSGPVGNIMNDLSQGRSAAPGAAVVVVLDTCPTRTDIFAAEQTYGTSWPSWLVETVQAPNFVLGAAPPGTPAQVFIDDPLPGMASVIDPVDQVGNSVLPGVLSGLFGSANPDDYLMSDHGLFVTGIVKDLAPTADVRLIRVLGAHGVGDVGTLVATLGQIPQQSWASMNPVVLNLSVVVDLPADDRFAVLWFPSVPVSPQELRRILGKGYDRIRRAVTETIDWLYEQIPRLLIVAAAGNDFYLNSPQLRNPRLPAEHAMVLGVAALDFSNQPAGYTNRGDETAILPPLPNGVAVWGGNAIQVGGAGVPTIPQRVGNLPDAIEGIFSAPTLPMGGGNNSTGWVYWSGTSFAAPIIAGLAAAAWAGNPGLTRQQIWDRFTTLPAATPTAYTSNQIPTLECPYVDFPHQ